MSDGSLQKGNKEMIIHSQSFTKEDNELLSNELNVKFGFSSTVISHKDIYWVIKIPSSDAALLHKLISPHMIPYFKYKVPVL